MKVVQKYFSSKRFSYGIDFLLVFKNAYVIISGFLQDIILLNLNC